MTRSAALVTLIWRFPEDATARREDLVGKGGFGLCDRASDDERADLCRSDRERALACGRIVRFVDHILEGQCEFFEAFRKRAAYDLALPRDLAARCGQRAPPDKVIARAFR